MHKTPIGRRLVVELIRFYQGLKWTGFVPHCCRFAPSCSEYAVGVVQRHGLVQGIRQIGARILRCRPGMPGGYDPVN